MRIYYTLGRRMLGWLGPWTEQLSLEFRVAVLCYFKCR